MRSVSLDTLNGLLDKAQAKLSADILKQSLDDSIKFADMEDTKKSLAESGGLKATGSARVETLVQPHKTWVGMLMPLLVYRYTLTV